MKETIMNLEKMRVWILIWRKQKLLICLLRNNKNLKVEISKLKYDMIELVTNSTLILNFLCISVLVFGECFYPLTLWIYSSFEDIAKAYSLYISL